MHPTYPIKCAGSGDSNFFKEVGVDVIRKTRSKSGGSVLVVAAIVGRLNCCKVIYERCPELLYIADRKAHTALHHAAWHGFDEIVKFLISAAANTEERDASGIVQDTESGRNQEEFGRRKLLMMANFKKQTALHSAVRKGHLQSAKSLLEADPSNKLLVTVDDVDDAAMHIAVRHHNLEIVKLLMETDPSFVYVPNKSGQTPHLIAVQESSARVQATVAIRNLLIEKQPRECEKRVGANGWTLLHHATHGGDVTSIEHILEFCPECVPILDKKRQNFVHVAAMVEHEMVIRCILASSKLNEHVLNQQDIHGNTPLHIVASKGNANVGLHLLYDSRVNKFVHNKKGILAFTMIKFDFNTRKAGVYGILERVDEEDLKNRSNFDLVVGALIATVSFTSGITVPGGFFDDGPNKGNAILHSKFSFQVFVLSNTIALALSLYAVFCHFCTGRFINEQNIIHQLKVATVCSLGAIFAMMVAFITGSYAVLAISDWLSNSVCATCCCFFGFASLALWRMFKEEIQRRQVLASLKIVASQSK